MHLLKVTPTPTPTHTNTHMLMHPRPHTKMNARMCAHIHTNEHRVFGSSLESTSLFDKIAVRARQSTQPVNYLRARQEEKFSNCERER